MHLAQIWPLIAAAVAIVGVIFRQMGLIRSELTTRIDGVATRLDTKIDGARGELDAKMDGTNARIDGLRAEMSAKFDGLRNEILAALRPMANTVERLDQDLRDHLKTHHGPT
ncbi:hypothetical protein [Actinomadura rupiterrae]|uniref:hypothetical protein n=1 Tax=Actinomadura rupiterrae TaxID=559627 RepID=UPI0020A57353|nr:hypothetical protein [Actinomadura rupiterrae]MCP2343459.1 hypothetical protein [Actinomadura rupiterrae]